MVMMEMSGRKNSMIFCAVVGCFSNDVYMMEEESVCVRGEISN